MAMPNKGRQLFITQTVEFSAAHRLAREDYSDEQNRSVFGKCANPNGHGHNYRLAATFSGQPDAQTGMVCHFDRIKALLQECVVEPMDHKNLNIDVPFLKDRLPTSENVLLALWDVIGNLVKDESFSLRQLTLWSSDRHRVDYYGEEPFVPTNA